MQLVTAGLHTDPLVIYREYIQNAVDSIATSRAVENGKVEINIDPADMRVVIRDNGPGLSRKQALEALIPIADSQKVRGADRGFRGIGRLSGLAFGNSVTFLTRRSAREPVSRIRWDGISLRQGITDGLSIEAALTACISTETIPGDDYPPRFFQVEVEGIARFAASSILNREVVRNYIAEVCPVPFAPGFRYAKNIRGLFEKGQAAATLDVFLNGEDASITRKHGNNIVFSEDCQDEFVEFEKVVIPAVERSKNAAVGWLAHSSYLGALPKKLGVRGVRARVGNIQLGDETLFDHLFMEDRFNRWCVGEVHILDPRIVPNGKRDSFEPSPHVRNLENHLGSLLHGIERRCRVASKERNEARRFQAFMGGVEEAYDLAKSGYLPAAAAKALVAKKRSEIGRMRQKPGAANGVSGVDVLEEWEVKLKGFRARPRKAALAGLKSSELPVYQKVFQVLAEHSASPGAAAQIIETILERTAK